MSTPDIGLLDTSVFIARESRRALEQIPARVAVSVVTLGELHVPAGFAALLVLAGDIVGPTVVQLIRPKSQLAPVP